MGGAETRRSSVRDEAAVFQRYAEVRGLLVRDDGAGVTIGLQKLPHDFVERDWLRAGQINHAVHRFRNRDAGKDRGHVIGNEGLHEAQWRLWTYCIMRGPIRGPA